MTQPRLFLRYENVRETIKKLCAPEIGEKLKPVWGLDEELELNSVWRDCGIDKMWIAFGMLGFSHHPHNSLNFHSWNQGIWLHRGIIRALWHFKSKP